MSLRITRPVRSFLRSFSQVQSTPCQVNASVIITRRPVVLRDLTPFECSYASFQEEVSANTSLPFFHSFYFKKGSLAEKEFFKVRKTQTSEISDTDSDSPSEMDQQESEDPLLQVFSDTSSLYTKRITDEDRAGDLSTLNRQLQHHLYLIVRQKGSSEWMFPTSAVSKDEFLHDAAKRLVKDMDCWVVGRTPIGVHLPGTIDGKEEKTFFMKTYILSGNFVGETQGIEYRWLTKKELQSTLSPKLYQVNNIMEMLPEI